LTTPSKVLQMIRALSINSTSFQTTNYESTVLITTQAPIETTEDTSIVLLGYSHFKKNPNNFSFNIYFISVLNKIYSRILRIPILIIYDSNLRALDDKEAVCTLQETSQEITSKVQYSCLVQADTSNIKQIKIEPNFNFDSQSNVKLVRITPLANMFKVNIQNVGDDFNKLSNSTIYVLDHSIYNKYGNYSFNISGVMNDPQPSFGETDFVLKINKNTSESNKEIEANCTILEITGKNYTLNCKSNGTSELSLQSAYSFIGDNMLLVNFDGQLTNITNGTGDTDSIIRYTRYNFKRNNGLNAGSIVAIVIVPIFVLAITIVSIYYFRGKKVEVQNESQSSILDLKKQVYLDKN